MTCFGQQDISNTEAGRDFDKQLYLGLILSFLLGSSCNVKNLGYMTEWLDAMCKEILNEERPPWYSFPASLSAERCQIRLQPQSPPTHRPWKIINRYCFKPLYSGGGLFHTRELLKQWQTRIWTQYYLTDFEIHALSVPTLCSFWLAMECCTSTIIFTSWPIVALNEYLLNE